MEKDKGKKIDASTHESTPKSKNKPRKQKRDKVKRNRINNKEMKMATTGKEGGTMQKEC